MRWRARDDAYESTPSSLAAAVPSPSAARIEAFDRAADDLFDHIRGDRIADRVFYAASAIGDHSLIWGVLAAARGLRPGPQNTRAAARALGLLLAESAL